MTPYFRHLSTFIAYFLRFLSICSIFYMSTIFLLRMLIVYVLGEGHRFEQECILKLGHFSVVVVRVGIAFRNYRTSNSGTVSALFFTSQNELYVNLADRILIHCTLTPPTASKLAFTIKSDFNQYNTPTPTVNILHTNFITDYLKYLTFCRCHGSNIKN